MFSVFASKTPPETIPIAFDAPHTITVRKLTGRQIETAQTEGLKSLVSGRSARARVRLLQAAVAGTTTEGGIQSALGDPLIGYDRHSLLRDGLVAWSYDATLDGAAIEDLDDDALEFMAREVLRIAKPGLFQTAGTAETERKNG